MGKSQAWRLWVHILQWSSSRAKGRCLNNLWARIWGDRHVIFKCFQCSISLNPPKKFLRQGLSSQLCRWISLGWGYMTEPDPSKILDGRAGPQGFWLHAYLFVAWLVGWWWQWWWWWFKCYSSSSSLRLVHHQNKNWWRWQRKAFLSLKDKDEGEFLKERHKGFCPE